MTEELQYQDYAEKEPTSLQAHMVEWIQEFTGVNPKEYEDKETSFAEGVRLGVALRMEYQRSSENRERTAAEREEREEEMAAARQEREEKRQQRAEEAERKRAEREEQRAAREEEREAKRLEREEAAKAKAAAKASKESVVEDEDEDEDEAPVKRVATKAKAAAPKRPAASRRGGKESPF